MKPRYKKILRAVLYFHGFLLLALTLTHCTFSRYARKSYAEAKRDKPYDVIIVPGIPYIPDDPSSILTMRIFWAKQLYDSGLTKNIIFSGSAVYSPYVEGIAMKVMADSLGIPPAHTFSETTAEHSTENAYYGWKMARSMGFKKMARATDPFQSGTLRSFIRKYCPGMKSVPVVFDEIDMDGKALPVINPQRAFRSDFVSIREREGFWKRFRGTMGKRVKDERKAEKEKQKAEGSKDVSTSE